mmetsp:Transcript_3731/g.6830  ORF Transcript_3731/g.6830 Transcript_3731/m.6830 type:complete len:297 (+) Transcript_3731:234-1124(+)
MNPSVVVTRVGSAVGRHVQAVHHDPGLLGGDARNPPAGVEIQQCVGVAGVQVQQLAGAVGGGGADALGGGKARHDDESVGDTGVRRVQRLLLHLLEIPQPHVTLLVAADHHVGLSGVEAQAGHAARVQLDYRGFQSPPWHPEARVRKSSTSPRLTSAHSVKNRGVPGDPTAVAAYRTGRRVRAVWTGISGVSGSLTQVARLVWAVDIFCAKEASLMPFAATHSTPLSISFQGQAKRLLRPLRNPLLPAILVFAGVLEVYGGGSPHCRRAAPADCHANSHVTMVALFACRSLIFALL